MTLMSRGLGLLLACALGCGAAPEPGRVVASTAAPVDPGGAARGPASARDLELGRGVPRDYQAAARLYAAACKGGRGELAACARFDDLARKRRGIDLDGSAATRHQILCERGVRDACDEGAYDEQKSCANGNWAHCGLAFAGSGCATQPTAACFDELARQARHGVSPVYDGVGVVADSRRLLAACDEGEADACAQLPGREIPLPTLCRANDHGACHRLACEGDALAARTDRAHHAERGVPCPMVAWKAQQQRQQARAATPVLDLTGTELPALRDEPPVGPITHAATPPFGSLAFRILGERYHGWPYVEVHDLSDKPIASLGAVAYGYDASGRQVARTADADKIKASEDATIHPLIQISEPGELSFRSPPPPPSAVHFEICYDAIRFLGELRDHVAGHCPAQKPPGVAFDPHREVGSVLLDRRTAHLLRDVSDAFEHAHPEVAVTTVSWPDLYLSDGYEPPPNFQGNWDARLPLALAPVAVVYNLPIQGQLRLSAAALAQIFQGQVARWNDPVIAADNPGLALPALPVTMVIGEPRGAMASFVCRAVPAQCPHGALAYEWRYTSHHDVDVRTTAGALTFVADPEDPCAKLPAARIKNLGGFYVAPSGAHATRAGRDATLDRDLAFQSVRRSSDRDFGHFR